ncbi:MAG: Xaa-Pro peptidase family protein [Rhodospirillales bacterium]
MALVAETEEIQTSGLTKPAVDMDQVQAYRLGRVRQMMREDGVQLCVLANPVSQRYAADHKQFSIFQTRLPFSYLFVPLEGPLVMHGTYKESSAQIHAFRPGKYRNIFDAGLDLSDQGRHLAGEIKDYLAELGIDEAYPKIACDRLNPTAAASLLQAGLQLCDAEPLVERARLIKSPEEVTLMRYAIAVAEAGMRSMEAALRPGITENQLLSYLHQTNTAHDGEWFECRILASGWRTNPWYGEATDKIIAAGELVGFDTDMVGPFGYCADISRTWLCGDGEPTAAQRALYRHAYDEVQHNIALIRPGLTFGEISRRAFKRRPDCIAHRYTCVVHGVGMSDEYPKIPYPEDWAEYGYDGLVEAGMVLCVESFTGSDQGGEGVKLEEMVLVTETGCERLSGYPFDRRLLA